MEYQRAAAGVRRVWELFDTPPAIQNQGRLAVPAGPLAVEIEHMSFAYGKEPVLTDVCLKIEAGRSLGWERYVGSLGAVIGINRFGASAPGGTIMQKYGMKASSIVAKAMAILGS